MVSYLMGQGPVRGKTPPVPLRSQERGRVHVAGCFECSESRHRCQFAENRNIAVVLGKRIRDYGNRMRTTRTGGISLKLDQANLS